MTLARLSLELLDTLGMMMVILFMFAILVMIMDLIWKNIKKGVKFIYRLIRSKDEQVPLEGVDPRPSS